jgi:hypothetical protein
MTDPEAPALYRTATPEEVERLIAKARRLQGEALRDLAVSAWAALASAFHAMRQGPAKPA